MTSPVRGGSEPRKFDIVGEVSKYEPSLSKMIVRYSVGSFVSNDPLEKKKATETGRNLRLVSKLWKDIADNCLPSIYWQGLQKPRLIGFRNLMADAQLRARAELQLSENEKPDYFSRFLALTSELRSRGAQIPEELSILSPHYYLKEQRVFDEALEMVWTQKIGRGDVRTAEEIRVFFVSPEGRQKIQAVKTLDLSELELKVLPPEIGLFTGLKKLYLNETELEVLPEWIGNLTGLETLSLRRNFFSELPDSIAALSQLKILDLEENELEVLPDSMNELQNLRSLNLKNNKLVSLPESFSDLKSLEELFLDNNQLTDILPITKISGLQALYLSGNKNIDVSSIEKLVNLEILYLEALQISGCLFKEIGELRNLIELSVRENQLTELPKEIGLLTNLLRLYVDNNQLEELPEEIYSLSLLDAITANNNQLFKISSSMKSLTELGTLYLEGNQLTSLPACIHSLEIDEKLLDGNPMLPLFNKDLTEIPADEKDFELRALAFPAKHEACLNYVCISPFAQLCQMIYRGEDKSAIKEKFNELSEEVRDRILGNFSSIPSSSTLSLEEIVFGRPARLIRALLKIAREELRNLSELEKEDIYTAAEFLIDEEKEINVIQVIDSVICKTTLCESLSFFSEPSSPPNKKRRVE